MRGSCLCCGIQLDTATRYVALADVIIGSLSFLAVFVHVRNVYNDTESSTLTFNFKYFNSRRYEYHSGDPNHGHIPKWVSLITLGATGLQCLMGVVLFVAVSKRSRKLCRLWLFVTIATCLFTGFILRIFQMLVVSEYSSELNIEDERAQHPRNLTGTLNSPVQVPRPQVPNQNRSIPMERFTNPNQHQSSSSFQINTSGNGPYYYHNHQYYSSTLSSTYMIPPTPPSVLPVPKQPEEYEEPPPPYHIAVASCPRIPPPDSCR